MTISGERISEGALRGGSVAPSAAGASEAAAFGDFLRGGLRIAVAGSGALAAGAAGLWALGAAPWPVAAAGVGGVLATLAAMRLVSRRLRALDGLEARIAEGERNRAALDHSSSNTMIADAEMRIVYVMPALERSLARSAKWWASQPTPVDATKLVGLNIDVFHKNSSRIRTMLRDLREVFVTTIGFDGRSFELRLTPIFDASGARTGCVVEWIEKTEALRAAKHIHAVIDAAARGDFTKRIDVAALPPENREIAEGLNDTCRIFAEFLDRLNDALGGLAAGDLAHRMDTRGEGRFRDLAHAVNATVEKLSEMVGDIQSVADELGTATRRIAGSASDLSARAESQAASLEQTAATMEEMASTVRSNADNADSSTGLAADTATRAGAGKAVVGEAVAAMDLIERSAGKISEITALIDSIAFQTNLLALNASVEAARAGEAGRGFAVVASEVRLLAQRSAEAARDIKGLIAESATNVGKGVTLVKQTGAALDGVTEAIAALAEKMSEISAATREQSSGVEEISSAVMRMDELTQQNAGLAEGAASGARALEAHADRLRGLVAFFRVGAGRETGARFAAE
ncbi:MAG: methyl-accepting chemotaxis protein [Rubrimonas sp.]